MPDLFVRFGGHQHAAGVTLEAARVDEFRERFNAYAAARLSPEDFLPRLEIDAVVELRRDRRTRPSRRVFALAPFGHGNPPPLFAALDVEVAGQPVVMKEKHLRVMVRQNGRTLVLKAWNFAERAGEMRARRARGHSVYTGGRRLFGRARLSRLGGGAARCPRREGLQSYF